MSKTCRIRVLFLEFKSVKVAENDTFECNFKSILMSRSVYMKKRTSFPNFVVQLVHNSVLWKRKFLFLNSQELSPLT